ncbi:MAG TPA: hypothetical protein DCF63_02830 [Planctomycetaceae bacterium]|nr:hypothetical protein [Planctomycetaceae bacterium]
MGSVLLYRNNLIIAQSDQREQQHWFSCRKPLKGASPRVSAVLIGQNRQGEPHVSLAGRARLRDYPAIRHIGPYR